MKTYRVFVTGEVEHTFTVEAEDEVDAQCLAESRFLDEFTCTSSGLDVGFDDVKAWDAEEEE